MINAIDKILKPFSDKLNDLEIVYEKNNKATPRNIDVNEKLKQLIFKDLEKPKYNYNYNCNYDNLPMPKKKNIYEMLEFDLTNEDFAKKIVEYRLLEIKKQLLIFEELVLQYIHIDLELKSIICSKNENKQKYIHELTNRHSEIKEHLDFIVQDENLEIFYKIYCKNNLLNQYFKRLNNIN